MKIPVKKIFTSILLISGTILPVTCKGYVEEPFPPAETAGIWRGSMNIHGSNGCCVLTLIDIGGNTIIILPGITKQFLGSLYAFNGTLSDDSYLMYLHSGFNLTWYDLTDGTFLPESSLKANFRETSYGYYTLALDLTYDALYDRPVSQDSVSGTWTGTDGDADIALNISRSGSMTGSDSNGCSYNGTVLIDDLNHNMYNIEITSSCVWGYGEGLGVLSDTDTTNDSLIAGVTIDWNQYVYQLKRQ